MFWGQSEDISHCSVDYVTHDRCCRCQLSDLWPSCPEVPECNVLSEAALLFSIPQSETFAGR